LCARYAASLEKAMVSVERIREYEGILQESYSMPRPNQDMVKTNGIKSELKNLK
jgi:hypothetical protein